MEAENKPEVYWNYRVCKEENADYHDELWDDHSIREVHYKGDKIVGYSETPVILSGFTSKSELKGAVEAMVRAFDKPVVDLDEIHHLSTPNVPFQRVEA